MNHIVAFVLLMLVTPSMGWAEPSTPPPGERSPLTLSGALGGRGILLGVELEGSLTENIRAGVGATAGPGGQRGLVTVPLSISLYPLGADGHAYFLDCGASFAMLSECCGGSERGGSDAENMILPFVGGGYAYFGNTIVFKMGVDFLPTLDLFPSRWFPIPNLRFGYIF